MVLCRFVFCRSDGRQEAKPIAGFLPCDFALLVIVFLSNDVIYKASPCRLDPWLRARRLERPAAFRS